MISSSTTLRFAASAVLLVAAAAMAGCERPPMETVQTGYRGTGMEEVNNPRRYAALRAVNVAPEALPAVESDGPRAREVYENVQVLGDLSVAEFNRIMAAMTSWVSPEQGCQYCHVGDNLADDGIYTKVVSRKMMEMTRHLNAEWTAHLGQTGVTCYTCHRGKNVPEYVWFNESAPDTRGLAASRAQQNIPTYRANLSTLPSTAFERFLVTDPAEIRVISKNVLPVGDLDATKSPHIKDTEWTYSLMTHMSEGLGVNCTYCHNSRSFFVWEQSTPQRVNAWHGIRMVRDINVNYLLPIEGAFPANRLGPLGDVAKVNCTTCHQNVNKPLFGAQMAKDYPELGPPRPAPVEPAADPSAASADSRAAPDATATPTASRDAAVRDRSG